jgi:hypothetical protein
MGFSLSRGYSRTKRKEKLSLKYVREQKIWTRNRDPVPHTKKIILDPQVWLLVGTFLNKQT